MSAGIWKHHICWNNLFRQATCVFLVAGLMAVFGCSSSSDTQSAVRQATEMGLTARITSPADGSRILFDASGQSENVTFTYTTNGGVGPYGYTFTVVGDNGFTSTASGSIDDNKGDATIEFVGIGRYTVTLTVNDANGNTANDSIAVGVDVDPNALIIVAQITSPSGGITINAGEAVFFAGQDLFGSEPISYSWAIPGGSVQSSSEEKVDNVTFANPGIYDVKFTVTDTNGLSSTDTVKITVK